jgi:hypothetical protein
MMLRKGGLMATPNQVERMKVISPKLPAIVCARRPF